MRIYTRAEWSARSPTKQMQHYRKRYIIIHHTASGNGVMSEAADLRYQYNCQGWHTAEHDATDILQAFTVFASGRIVEGRMPWDSDNGAIYNAGGGAVDGVGIECDGTFYGRDMTSAAQYEALVWLCAEIVKRCNIDTRQARWTFGHREIYPCRLGDPKSTACPGNLLAQFVTNGKLQKDVLALLQGDTPKKGDKRMQTWEYKQVTKVAKIDCYRAKADYHVTTDGATRNLVFTLEGKDGSFAPVSTEGQDIKTNIQHDHNLQDILKQDRFKSLKGSYKLIITCADAIDISIRENPK